MLRQFPEGLFDHLVEIGSWFVTLDNTFDRVIVEFQSMSIFVMNWKINGEQRNCGFSRGLTLATGLPEALCSSSLVCIDSVTYLTVPLTIRTQEAVWS